jgi:hypothetical protein
MGFLGAVRPYTTVDAATPLVTSVIPVAALHAE